MKLFSKNVSFNGIDFIEIEKLTKDEFYSFYSKMPFEFSNLWQMNYTYIMTSENAQKKHYYKIINDMLCVFQRYSKGLALLFIPIGDINFLTETLAICFDIMKKCSHENYQIRIDWVNETQMIYLSDNFKFQKMKENKSQFNDYIYDPYMVSCCEGSDYKYIRRKINKFKSKYPEAVIREYKDDDYERVMLLSKKWKEYVMNDIERYKWLVDASYYKNTILNRNKLGHKVFVCEYKDEIIGLVSGEKLTEDYAWCFNRKPLNEYDGLSEYLVWYICDYFKDCLYLNDGSGNSGLSFFKERFRPVCINPLYICNGLK